MAMMSRVAPNSKVRSPVDGMEIWTWAYRGQEEGSRKWSIPQSLAAVDRIPKLLAPRHSSPHSIDNHFFLGRVVDR